MKNWIKCVVSCTFCVRYLDISHHSRGLHSAGYIDCIAPDVIVRFTSSNYTSKNSSFIQTWRHQHKNILSGMIQTEMHTHQYSLTRIHWPIRSMKLLKDCLLRLLRVTFIAKAKSARSERCCQRSINDWSSGCGKANTNASFVMDKM